MINQFSKKPLWECSFQPASLLGLDCHSASFAS